MTINTQTTDQQINSIYIQDDLFADNIVISGAADNTLTIVDSTYSANPYNYTTVTTNGPSAYPYILSDTISISDYLNTSHQGLKVNGDAEIDGDLKIKGKSIVDMIENIEKRLAILHPNPELEDKWEKLKLLGEKYRKLEQEIIEKQKCWDILKK